MLRFEQFLLNFKPKGKEKYLFGIFLIIRVVRESSPLIIISKSDWYCFLLSTCLGLSILLLWAKSIKASKPTGITPAPKGELPNNVGPSLGWGATCGTILNLGGGRETQMGLTEEMDASSSCAPTLSPLHVIHLDGRRRRQAPIVESAPEERERKETLKVRRERGEGKI